MSKERLTIDEIIAHCKRMTQKFEKYNKMDLLENNDMEAGMMKEYWEHRQVAEYLEELKQYRDLEEQGLLLRLPVAVGGSIWDNDFGSPYRYEVTGFSYGDINEDDYDYDEELPTDELIVHYRNYNGSITGKFPISEIGKTVFLTQSEAEEKLRELEEK